MNMTQSSCTVYTDPFHFYDTGKLYLFYNNMKDTIDYINVVFILLSLKEKQRG